MMVKIGPNLACPCLSKQKYKKCCSPLHRGRPAPTPIALMRSRFSAYAIGLAPYIVDTTDPEGPQWQWDLPGWLQEITQFSTAYDFVDLAILSHTTHLQTAMVTFRATLKSGHEDEYLCEKSHFTSSSGRWLYHSGTAMPQP
jgi:SEC-C motif-containing protein